MRLVSVVVPLWLIATTSVSLMSVASRKPDSSVASTASTVTGVAGPSASLQRDREALARDRGRALADRRAPGGSLRRAGGRGARRTASRAPSSTTGPPSRSMILPRSVLRNDAGASEISFSR